MSHLLRRVREVALKVPYLIAFAADGDIGRHYGVGLLGRLRLIAVFHRNTRRVKTLSSVVEHLELAATLLRMPPTTAGLVIECGCFQGGSSVNLSLVAAMVGRRLLICDSFQGLPDPEEYDRDNPVPHRKDPEQYYEGQFAASLDTVKANLERYGRLDVCDFKVGFFEESLHDLEGPVALAFLDIDLIDSLRPCLRAIWPQLAADARVYVHEAGDLGLVATFFEGDWWRSEMDEPAPGFVGAGTGLPLMPLVGSELGYAMRPAATDAKVA